MGDRHPPFCLRGKRKDLTVRQVAKKLDLTEGWVRNLIARKEIKAVRIGQWRIKLKDEKH